MRKKNLKKFNIDTRGVSIPMVMVALALVAAGTVYIMNINKTNTVNFAKSRSTSFAETERRRISNILSDNSTCKKVQNFGGSNPVRSNITSLVTSNGTTFVTTATAGNANRYYNKTLTLTNIQTRINPDPDAPFPGTAKQYELVLSYTNTASTLEFAGKKSTIIRIPMYMKVDGSSNVVDCYAMGELNEVDRVITAACSPNKISSSSARSMLYRVSTTDTTATECQNDIVFDNTTNTDCGTSSAYKFMTGLMVSSAASPNLGKSLQFSTAGLCGTLSGVAATAISCTGSQIAYAINGGALTCQDPGTGAKDTPACSTGQILYKTGTSSSTCVTVDCSGSTNNFVSKVLSTGVDCYQIPTSPCPAGQYISGFDSSGTRICKDLPITSGSCAGGTFGTDVTRTDANPGGTLTCTAYSISKSCAGASGTTFAYELGTTGTASCTTW